MKGWGITARPPRPWIAATVSARGRPEGTGASRNQPRTWVCAGQAVVTSMPVTTCSPTSSPRARTSAALAIVSWSVMAIRSRPAALAAATSSAGETIPSEAVVWQCGSATPTSGRREKSARERLRVELDQVVDPLPHPGELDRDPELRLHRQDSPALGAAVQLGQHEAGQGQRGGEPLRLRQGGLPEGGVEHEQRLVRRPLLCPSGHPCDLRELLQQVVLRLQAPRGVDEHHVVAAA